MKKFKKLEGIAAPMNLVNIDTDMIIPKQFLKTIKREGLGKHLFDEMRFTPDGQEKPDFILNQDQYRETKIIIAGDNFGCGSSREHAPWALMDFGITAIISTSYADIFYNNCFKNGILPIILPEEDVKSLMEESQNPNTNRLTIDLATQTIITGKGDTHNFTIDPARKTTLLEGLDDIAQTQKKKTLITNFENTLKKDRPWI